MIIFRRRLLLWLFKAYLKRWGKTIVVSFIIGLLFFFCFRFVLAPVLAKLPVGQKESLGIVGSYEFEDLPSVITNDLSYGLTQVRSDGTVSPKIARSWQIANSGKTYVFNLRPDVSFTDGTNLTSDLINFSFQDVTIEKPTPYVIIFRLKESYAPFLVTVSRPIFKKGLVGVGEFSVQDIELNGNFVSKLVLVSRHNKYHIRTYHFYPSQEALKTAFALGEINKAIGLSDTKIQQTDFSLFPSVKKNAVVNTTLLATLFFNTKDSLLSSDKLRNGLSYAIPDSFVMGVRSYGPYAKESWAFQDASNERVQDMAHAAILAKAGNSSSESATLALTLKTLAKYRQTADIIASSWKKLNIDTKIEEVDTVPETFQVFLGDIRIPFDPDQYTLWHSSSQNNITHYRNLRIDKLLEDGRKTIDTKERKKIYEDFQKYLLVDSPAIFLYFPYEYEVTRK